MYLKLKSTRVLNQTPIKELCKLLGIESEATYYRRENGSISFKVEEAKILAKFYKTTVEELFQR
jgi:transcriptional regulator with XRE-family HTH domain